jgi:hypothetical protein
VIASDNHEARNPAANQPTSVVCGIGETVGTPGAANSTDALARIR